MAKAAELGVSSVQRIWRAHGLQLHRAPPFELSKDPRFVDELRDVVGLYVDPPAHAIVLSVDENSQIQALDRTQPGLPMKKGRAGTMTHDYARHGATTLFAAVNVLDGAVIGPGMQRHAARNSSASSMSSRNRFRREGRSASSSTTTRPANIPTIADGSNVIRDGRSPSRRSRPPGSTPSRASSLPSQSEGSSAAFFAPSPTCKALSNAASRNTISSQIPSHRLPIPRKSSPRSDVGDKCRIRSASGEFVLQSGVDAFGHYVAIINRVVRIAHVGELPMLRGVRPFDLDVASGAGIGVDDRGMAGLLAVAVEGDGWCAASIRSSRSGKRSPVINIMGMATRL